MRIVYRVQHAAGRDEPLARLLAGMPLDTEVVTDTEVHDPNPWRNYKRCLTDLPGDVTRVVVIQDDAVVCRNFAPTVERIVQSRPNDLVSLFVGGLPGKTRMDFLTAYAAGRQWTPIWFREIHHVVALIWPVDMAQAFLAWSETASIPGYRRVPRSDDAILGTWLRQTRQTCWACVPCLVQHPDDVPTLIHQRERSRGGDDRGRVAVAWIGPDADPLALDWAV